MKHPWQKQDWRKVRMEKHPAHACIRWFHWSWRPRVYICYWEQSMYEQRTMVFRWEKL